MMWDLTIEITIKEKWKVLSNKTAELDEKILVFPNGISYYLREAISDLWIKVWVEVKNSIKQRLWRR